MVSFYPGPQLSAGFGLSCHGSGGSDDWPSVSRSLGCWSVRTEAFCSCVRGSKEPSGAGNCAARSGEHTLLVVQVGAQQPCKLIVGAGPADHQIIGHKVPLILCLACHIQQTR